MKRILLEIIASLLVLLFLYTSVSKFLEFKLFIGEMNNQPFPNWMTPYLVWTLPSVEILISLGLIFERTRKWALYGSLMLMSLFTIYTALVLFRFFPYVPCSCGGVIRNLTWPQHLVFNLFFVALSFAGIKLKQRLGRQTGNLITPSLINN